MNLEEARKVLWLKSNHRPLGELFDEGYLNQTRLEWAAEKAYDPALKEASKFLLNWLKQSSQKPVPEKKDLLPSGVQLPSGINLEQARATSWSLAPFKGQPMGMLVETKQISMKDLGYAIENAWDERVRKAAMVLMLVRLGQAIKEPETPSGFLNVISGGKSYAEFKQDQLTLIQGMMFGAVLASLIGWVIWTFPKQSSTQTGKSISDILSTPTGIIAFIVAISILVGLGLLTSFLFEQIIKKIDKQKENYRKGEEGENRVVESMGQVLDGNWSLFRNIVLPGRKKTDLDAVLVGPSGVWALEVKTFTGTYRTIGEHWEYRIGNRWKLSNKNPSRQAKDNAVRLSDFFKADNISQWVTPAVIWANQEAPLAIENPSVAVWQYSRIPDELGNIWQGEKLAVVERNKITEKLSRLCEQQRKPAQ